MTVAGSARTTTVVLVHVLLAALALAAMAVWGPGDDPALAYRQVTVPDADPRLPENPELVALVRPPGRIVLDSAALQHGDPPAALGEAEGDVLEDAGVVTVKAIVGREGELTNGVWQMAVRDGADPRDALRAIDELYAKGGWTPEPSGTRGVVVRGQKPGADQPITGYRAHYLRGRYLIRIEAYGTDPAAVDQAYAALAQRQLAAWPPR